MTPHPDLPGPGDVVRHPLYPELGNGTIDQVSDAQIASQVSARITWANGQTSTHNLATMRPVAFTRDWCSAVGGRHLDGCTPSRCANTPLATPTPLDECTGIPGLGPMGETVHHGWCPKHG